MESSLKVFVAFAILSNVLCFDLGHLLGLRKDLRDLSNEPAEPEIVEVIRWRQSVCIVPAPGVPPCLMALRTHQDEYERNSAKGIEANEPKTEIVKEQARINKVNQKAAEGYGQTMNDEFLNYCSDALFFGRNEEICGGMSWYRNALTTQDVELESNIAEVQNEFGKKKTTDFEVETNLDGLIDQYCMEKLLIPNPKESNSEMANLSMRFLKALKEMGVLKEEDSIDLDSICDDFGSSPKMLSPQVVDSLQVESVDPVELESSEWSGRSNLDHTVTLNLRSSTPGMEESRIERQGRYLLIADEAKSAPTARSPPAIYVTKVLNSPVTATLVAHNCFPDIGVPMCDEYQETITIYNEEDNAPRAQRQTATTDDDLPESTTEPVTDPSEEETTEGSTPETTEESTPETTEESTPETTEGSTPETTETTPETTDESTPETTESSDPTTTESSDPTTTGSSDPTTTGSSDPTTTEKSDPTTTEKSDPTTTEKSDPTTTEESVQENTESPDFWNDPNDPHFDNGTESDEPQRPYGLLGQAIQHVLSKPGVVNAIPTDVIHAIANNPAILEALVNAGNPGGSPITVTEIKPQVVTSTESSEIVVPTTTSKPGFISSLLNHRPAILNHFWHPAFNFFNKSTTAKPEKPVKQKPHKPFGHRPIIEAIQNIIHRPQTVDTDRKPGFHPVLVVEPTKRPGLFQHLWNPAGGLGLFDRLSTTTAKPKASTTAKPKTSTTAKPKGSTTAKPKRPTTAKPKRPTTAKPKASTTAKPKASTTEEPNVFISDIDGGEEPVAKPTQAPGLFGGLFSNPSRPLNSIFARPTNRPLIIKRPGAKPLVVEKPIYVQEKPPLAGGLLNFFLPAGNRPLLNVDHEVIKEPVYVYQKPQTVAGILSNIFGRGTAPSRPGFFQGWAALVNRRRNPVVQEKSNSKTKKAPQGVQNMRSLLQQPEAQTSTVDEITEEAASPQAPPTSAILVEDNTEKIAALQTPSKSAVSVEDNAEEIADLQTPLKSSISVEDNAEEKAALQSPLKSADPVEDIAEEIAELQTPLKSDAPVEDIAEEIAELQTPLKSAVPVEDIAEEIAELRTPLNSISYDEDINDEEERLREVNIKLIASAVEPAPQVTEVKSAILSDSPTSLSDISNLPAVEELEDEDAEAAVEAQAILEDSEKNLTQSSEAAADEAEIPVEESVIDNEA